MVSLLFVIRPATLARPRHFFFVRLLFWPGERSGRGTHPLYERGVGDQRVARVKGNFKALLKGGVGQAPLISSKSGLHALKKLATMDDKPA